MFEICLVTDGTRTSFVQFTQYIVRNVNVILKNDSGIEVIDNSDISAKHLGKKKVHLNPSGSTILARNILNSMKRISQHEWRIFYQDQLSIKKLVSKLLYHFQNFLKLNF